MSRGQVTSSAVPAPSVSSGGKLTTRPLPPPPVPPRPSKSLVAAALARSRAADVCKSDRPHVPTRKAPPPPTTPPVAKERTQDVSKSQVVNHGPMPQERTQQFHKILNNKTEVLQQGNGVGYHHGEPLKNLGENGVNYSRCETTALHLGKRVTQSSVNGEGRRKGDFENCINVSCLSGKFERRDAEEFRKVHHSKLSCNNGSLVGRSGQLLELGNRVMTGDDGTLLEIKCDPRLEERNGRKFHDSQKKTDMEAVTQSLSSEERLPAPKPEEHKISVVSHVITTNPQNQETVSFPQRNEGKINERPASNDHRQQTGTLQEVQNHCSRTQHAILLNGRDECTRSETVSEHGGYCENKPATVVKQNGATEDKQQKIRTRATHVLPTGQHRHDSTYISSSGSRNTILLVDNSPSKRDKLHSVSQNRSTDNKNLTVNGIVGSSCCPLVENLIVELKESSQQRTHLQCNDKSSGSLQTHNGVNSTGNKENEFIESVFKKNSQPRIQHSDWFEVDNGKPVRYSSCHITLEDSCTTSSDSSNTESSSSTMDLSRSNSFQYTDCSELSVDVSFDYRAQLISQRHPAAFNSRRNMASLQGLPPLPKSLSGINLFETSGGNLHFSPMDQQQLKQDASSPRGLAKSGSFRQLASQNSSSGSGGGAGSIGSNSGAVRVVPSSSSGRGPTPPTPGGTSHQQILHHQHLRSHQQNGDVPAPPIVPRVRKPTGLDAQLAILRKEMVSSRHWLGSDVL